LYHLLQFIKTGGSSRWMRWAGQVTQMEENRNAYRMLVGKPDERGHWEVQDVGGWTIIK
jgi:hypothetical protein